MFLNLLSKNIYNAKHSQFRKTKLGFSCVKTKIQKLFLNKYM